jgi:hypothetical protein
MISHKILQHEYSLLSAGLRKILDILIENEQKYEQIF